MRRCRVPPPRELPPLRIPWILDNPSEGVRRRCVGGHDSPEGTESAPRRESRLGIRGMCAGCRSWRVADPVPLHGPKAARVLLFQ
jgi:hypothetical protein